MDYENFSALLDQAERDFRTEATEIELIAAAVATASGTNYLRPTVADTTRPISPPRS